jgi:competence protein ComEC
VWELTLVNITIATLTFPLAMARFHVLAIVSLVLNTILWVPMTVALWFGMAVLALGLVFPDAAPVFGWCCDRSLWLLEWGIEAARQIPGSYFWVPGPADWWLAGFYGGVGLLLAFPRLRPPRRWCVALVAGWVAVGLAVPLLAREKPQLRCTFLSVGHGCAAVLRLPSGKTMLYDAGAFTSPERATHAISSYLWSQGIRHVDAVLLSHADADHYNGVPGLLERFSVGVAYVSPVMFENRNPALDALDNSLRRNGVPVREVWAGDVLSGGEGCRMEIFHPPRRGVLGGDNPNSVVLAIDYLGRRILLTGDLGPPGLKDLLDEEPWHCDVLLAPHHGTIGSNPRGLAQWSTPHFVVVSGGLGVDVRQTTASYRKLGAEVLHTGKMGAIQVLVDQEGLRVTTGENVR